MKPDKVPLTEAEKLVEKRRKTLNNLCNSIISHWSFKSIKCWADVYKFTTVPANATPAHLAAAVPKEEILAYIKKLKDDFEKSLAPVVTTAEPVVPVPLTTEVEIKPATSVVTTSEEVVEALSSKNDYGLKPSPNEKAFFYWFQKKAIAELLDDVLNKGITSKCLISGTGTGKTYMMGGFIRRLVDINYHDNKTFSSTSYLYVTRATIVEQTKRVFRDTFNLGIKDGVEVLNIEQLRSRAGKMWVTEESKIENGEEVFYWKWKKGLTPCVVIWDECQALKNQGSTQSQIAAALNDMKGVVQLHVSATPFARVAEAKCFAVSTHKDITHIMGIPSTLSNETWPTYANHIAQGDPLDYNEAAIERLVKDLDRYIVRVKGVRPQFDAINKVEVINFQSKEECDYYTQAWERYLKEKEKLDQEALKNNEPVSGISVLVEFLKFRMAAEFCRKDYLAKRMLETVTKDGKAAVCALNFKGTIIEIVKLLVDTYGVPRHKIALVWGGGQTQLTKKQKAKQAIKEKAERLQAAGIDADELLEDLDLDEVEDRILQDLPEHLKLGAQSPEERQKEIDRFQSGKADYCLFTFRAGGVGLSLHHTDEQSPIKVRHKESGYAVEEDIPKVPIKPRRLFAAPTYSAMEIVQGLGRCPRLTSLSHTEQFLVFYRGTIEEKVASVVSNKLRCLTKVVRNREKWSDIITEGKAASSHIMDIPDDDPDDNALEGQSTSEEE